MDRTLANTARKLKRDARRHTRLPAIWWMSGDDGPEAVLAAAGRLPRGAAVVLRHYGLACREALAGDLARLCRRLGHVLLVAGDWRLAARVGARGCHLPEHMAKRGPAPGLRLWRRHKTRIVSVAAHSALALRRAAGADAALLSPVFATPRYPGRKVLGPTRAALMARAAPVPVMALGGITAPTARMLRGVAGIAGIGFGGTR